MTPSTRSLLALALALAAAACNGAASDEGSAPGPDDSLPDASSLSPKTNYTKTKYPIVLAHGLFGFKELFGVIDYFYKVPDELRSSGAQVFVTQVSAVNSSTVRGEQLLKQVEAIVAQTGAGKVNLIGHSQGGIDARYVMGVRPDLVASLTTVGSPHTGADLADFLVNNISPDGFTGTVLTVLGNSLGTIIDLLAGKPAPQDLTASLRTLSAAGAAEFNKKFSVGLPATRCGQGPSSNGAIPLYSWAGTGVTTNPLDVSDVILDLSSTVYGEANDGLVGRCSAHFGKVLRDDYAMNHLDEINQLFSLTSVFETNPISVYREHANRLKLAGL